MKNTSWGAEAKTILSLVIMRYPAPIIYVMPQGQKCFLWGAEMFFISAVIESMKYL